LTPLHDTRITARVALEKDLTEIERILKGAEDYFLKVEGVAVSQQIAHREWTDGPSKTAKGYRKEFLILKNETGNFGIADLHFHHPEFGTAYIGLLLVMETFQKKGLGSAAYRFVESYARDRHGIQKLLLGVSDRNDVKEFWTKMGFSENGKIYDHAGLNLVSRVTEMQKRIT
jgi:GNAT superfamily N-acetyltransferase